MLASYTKGLTEDQAAEAKAEFLAAFRYRERNIKLLEGYIEQEQEAMLNDEHFESSRHINRIAKIQAYKRIIKLMS